MDSIDKIFMLLEENGMKQVDLAKATGLGTGNITDWKSRKANPSIDALCRIADYFHVTVDWLAGRSEIRNIDSAIAVYQTGVDRWLNDIAFKPNYTPVIKSHFVELLIRYKALVNELSAFMYSETRRSLVSENASLPEKATATCSALQQQLSDLISWIAYTPIYFDQTKESLPADIQKARNEIYTKLSLGIANVMTEDETDLLEIWRCLNKDGQRIVIGTAVQQKQKAESK